VMHSIRVGFALPLHSFREQQYGTNVNKANVRLCNVSTNIYLYALILQSENTKAALQT